MSQQGAEPSDGDQRRPPEQPGPVTPPGDWYAADAGAMDRPRPTPEPPHPGSRGEQMPALDGARFTRATEHNRRAVIGMVLSGLALAGLLAWFGGFLTPVLVVLALALGGMVMGLRGRAAARNGLATNGGLALAAIITGAVAVVGIIGIYALLLYALSQWG